MTQLADQAARAARNELVLTALGRATSVLRVQGIDALPIKGGALLADGIVRPWARHLDDLDLWVDEPNARRAWSALLAEGFVPAASFQSTTHAGRDALDGPGHQFPTLRSPVGALVELHRESHATGDAGDFAACYAAGHDVSVRGAIVRVPATLHTLEHLCGHVVVHHFGDLRFWPRHVDDVRALVRREPALRSLRARPDEVGLSLRVLHGVEEPASVDGWLARLFLDPSPLTAAAWRSLSLAHRTGRFAFGGSEGLWRVLFPAAAHLAFTGDLANGRGFLSAQARRWRRIALRLLSSGPAPR